MVRDGFTHEAANLDTHNRSFCRTSGKRIPPHRFLADLCAPTVIRFDSRTSPRTTVFLPEECPRDLKEIGLEFVAVHDLDGAKSQQGALQRVPARHRIPHARQLGLATREAVARHEARYDRPCGPSRKADRARLVERSRIQFGQGFERRAALLDRRCVFELLHTSSAVGGDPQQIHLRRFREMNRPRDRWGLESVPHEVDGRISVEIEYAHAIVEDEHLAIRYIETGRRHHGSRDVAIVLPPDFRPARIVNPGVHSRQTGVIGLDEVHQTISVQVDKGEFAASHQRKISPTPEQL